MSSLARRIGVHVRRCRRFGSIARRPGEKSGLASTLAILLVGGCGYVMSGDWDDDPGNWDRAFGGEPPADVTIVHSRYQRSAHFTYEFEYFFHLKRNERVRKSLFANGALVRIDDGDDGDGDGDGGREALNFCGEKPEWFLPKGVDAYDVWGAAEEPQGEFRLFIDRADGDLFLSDHQI